MAPLVLPTLAPTTTQLPPQTDVKIPKKRGRKKGSKGIDSLLATQNEGAMQTLFNADSFSDLKQKITSIAGHKKVKTTKEILSDIQNKRSASGSTVTSPSVTQAPSPESAMSGKSFSIFVLFLNRECEVRAGVKMSEERKRGLFFKAKICCKNVGQKIYHFAIKMFEMLKFSFSYKNH